MNETSQQEQAQGEDAVLAQTGADAGAGRPEKARYIMVGGFLGAGKTTAVARLAERLTEQGLRVGLITNDQGSELVDTAALRAKGFATEEIPGGCFCCRFNSLLDAAARLTAASRPDAFVAEPVGSCTDLVATVTYPLRRIYGERFSIAPLTVLVDPIRALRVFNLESGPRFSDKVLYIYRKQLEEADLIAINKCDLVESSRKDTLRRALENGFPQAEVLEISARNGAGLDAWFERVATAEQSARAVMEIDYDLYAEGEALLGWLNATVRLTAAEAFEAEPLLRRIADGIQSRLREAGSEVAHLKMTLSPDTGLGQIGVINLVRNDFVPELSQALEDPVENGQLIINLRAESAPELLREAVRETVDEIRGYFSKVDAVLEHLECFQPGRPTPTHRYASLV